MLETFRFTLRIMKKRPLRSLLTILQLGLGVWIVAIILSLNLQASGTLNKVNQTLGDSLAKLSISQEKEMDGGGRMLQSSSNFRLGDLARLEESQYIESAFVYETRWERDILVNNLAYRVSPVAEVSAKYAVAMNLEMMEGQFFTQADQEQGNKVVVISEIISKQLFPNQSPLGQTIDLARFGEGTLEFEIIGVYKRQSPLLEFFISESYLIFPLGVSESAHMTMEVGDFEPQYHELFIKSTPGMVYEGVADAQILLANRTIDAMEVRGEYFKDSNRFFQDQIQMITLFLGSFAFVSILISAIGILSIMLVSVVERTREIGLRQALGASRKTIVLQILNESFVFSILGAALGLVAAYFSAETLVNLLVQEITYPKLTGIGGLHPQAALVAGVLAILAGQIFGLYPAIQAAKMAPVEAIREL